MEIKYGTVLKIKNGTVMKTMDVKILMNRLEELMLVVGLFQYSTFECFFSLGVSPISQPLGIDFGCFSHLTDISGPYRLQYIYQYKWDYTC